MNDPLLEKPDYNIDPSLQSGPIDHRPCRDPFFIIIFLAYIGFMAYIGIRGLVQGDPELLLTPFDSSGHQCEHDKNDSDYVNYPYIAIWKQPVTNNWIGTCVKGCSQQEQKQCKTNNVTTNCDQMNTYSAWTLDSICVPSEKSDQIKSFFNSIGLTSFVQFFQDIKVAWPVVAGSIGIATAISLIYVVLLQQCIGCIIWGGITLFLIAFGGVGIMMLVLPSSDALKKMIHYDSLPPTLQDLSVIKYLGITSVCICGIFLLLVLCLCKRINTSINILKAAGSFLKSNISIISVPLITLLIQAITIMAWLVVMMFLASCGNISAAESETYFPFGWVDWSQTTRYFMIAQIFGLIWIIMFISGSQKYMISSSVAIWYYEQGYPERPILRSVPRLIKSAGSIAFGSLLLLITFIIRLALQYISNEYNKANKGIDNAVGKCCLKCLECIVACFVKCIEFITDKAYVMMAISGKSFCNSAAEGTGLTISCFGVAAAVETSTRIFGIIGRLLITASTTIICLIMITSIPSISYNLFSTLGPILAFILISFCVSTIFIEAFRMIAETLLMCYCIEKQFGGRQRCPKHVKGLLQDYVDQSTM